MAAPAQVDGFLDDVQSIEVLSGPLQIDGADQQHLAGRPRILQLENGLEEAANEIHTERIFDMPKPHPDGMCKGFWVQCGDCIGEERALAAKGCHFFSPR